MGNHGSSEAHREDQPANRRRKGCACVRSASSDIEEGQPQVLPATADSNNDCAEDEPASSHRSGYMSVDEHRPRSQFSTSSEAKRDSRTEAFAEWASGDECKGPLCLLSPHQQQQQSGPTKKISACSNNDCEGQYGCPFEDPSKGHIPLAEEAESLLRGKLSEGPAGAASFSHKDISVFVISSGEDTAAERNELLRRALPQLKSHCKMQGCRMIGLNANKLGEHRHIDAYTHRQLCLRVLKAIGDASNLVLILLIRDDPGKMLLPEAIGEKDFQDACEALDPKNRKKLEEYFHRSGNSYLLLKKEGIDDDDDDLLLAALKSAWDEDVAKMHLRSTFEEVVHRMLNGSPSGLKSTICLKVRPVGRSAEEIRSVEIHHERLADLDAKIQEAVDENNVLQFTVKLKDGAVDPSYPSHSQYLDDVCARMMPILTSIVDSDIMPCMQVDPLPFGIDRWLATELKQVDQILKSLSTKPFSRERQLEEFRMLIEAHSTGQAIVLHGEHGCGKTTFIVSVINSLKHWFPGCATLFRFGGMTPQTRISPNLFRTIAIQLSYFMDETAHQQYRKYPSKERLLTMLEKLPADLNLFLIIDGIDQLQKGAVDAFEWLPLTNLPSNIKIIISLGTSTEGAYTKMRSSLGVSQFFELKNLSTGELVSAAKSSMLKDHHYIPTGSELEHIHECLTAVPSLCAVQLLAQLSTTGNLDHQLPTTLEGLLQELVESMEHSSGSNKATDVLLAIASTRQGVAAEEFEEFFSENTQEAQDSLEESAPSFDGAWIAVLFAIRPFLHTLNIGGLSVYTFSSPFFKDLVRSLGNGPSANKPTLKATQRSLKKLLQETMSAMDGRDKCHALEEVPHLAFQLEESLEEYTFAMNWLFEKICKCGVTEVENDICLAITRNETNCGDLQLLFSALQLSGYALNADPSQFFTQMYTRLTPLASKKDFYKKHPRIAALYLRIQEFPKPSLIPLRPCLDSPTKFDQDEHRSGMMGWLKLDSKLFPIPTDPGYVISLSAARGELGVWNCVGNECVRCLKDLQEPKTLRVLPGKRKAVCLCGRELVLIDLAEGKVERKIKGIMNQKLPLYALVDEYHLITLARNRMYLNLINIESGDCISTFKVGEDRFLNSLVVSDNGKICVCGDETQKPFPLLVWDLEKRKLVFDLRIPHHEFLTHLMAITKEGHYVACACEEIDRGDPMFIVVYDLQNGTQFKRLKPGKPLVALAVSSPRNYPCSALPSPSRSPHLSLQALLTGHGGSGSRTPMLASPISGTPPMLPLSGTATPTPGGLFFQEPHDPYVIASRADAQIMIWDLITGSLRWTLKGHTVGPDTLRVDESGERLFTYDSKGIDPTLRLWSLTTGTLIASFTPDDPFVDSSPATLGSKTVIYASSPTPTPDQSEECEGNIVALVLGDGPNWKDDMPLVAEFGTTISPDVIDIQLTLPNTI